MLYKCEVSYTFPFFLIKENLCIIPIHSKEQLCSYIEREGMEIIYDYIYSNNKFSIYNSKGPIYIDSSQVEHDTI